MLPNPNPNPNPIQLRGQRVHDPVLRHTQCQDPRSRLPRVARLHLLLRRPTLLPLQLGGHLLTYLRTYLLTYLLAYLLTCLLTCAQVEILNQVAQTARVRDVAELVAKLSGAEIQRVANPRQEDAENELEVDNDKFKLLGLDPILLDSAEGLMTEVREATLTLTLTPQRG